MQIDLFHNLSNDFSRRLTEKYSTSFSIAVKLLSPAIRQDIYNIYGFVRIADEIVDTFHDYPKEDLLDRFENDVFHAITYGISTNPVLNSFQQTKRKYRIEDELIHDFLSSMRMDLHKQSYNEKEYHQYIYGSADAVGLMCLKVFVNGDDQEYEKLKASAMRLGSAFQKVNFLRDMNADQEELNRNYFPGLNTSQMTTSDRTKILDEIKLDFSIARKGIQLLPHSSRLGVMIAYRYYYKLLRRLERVSLEQIKSQRIRIPDFKKIFIIVTSYMMYKLSIREEAW